MMRGAPSTPLNIRVEAMKEAHFAASQVTLWRDTGYVPTKDVRCRERERVRGQRERQRECEYVHGELGMNVDDEVRRCWVRGWVLVQGYDRVSVRETGWEGCHAG